MEQDWYVFERTRFSLRNLFALIFLFRYFRELPKTFHVDFWIFFFFAKISFGLARGTLTMEDLLEGIPDTKDYGNLRKDLARYE
jgi:hypothetical protein